MTTIAERHPPAARFSTAARFRGWLRNPWGRPRFLIVFTWAYILWSIVPVLIAVQFSFNATRSRTIWDSFSTRWYWGDPVDSVWHDPTLRHALVQTFKLAGADVLIAVPIGVLLALGLARWRGRGSGVSNFIMLFPLVTPEIVDAIGPETFTFTELVRIIRHEVGSRALILKLPAPVALLLSRAVGLLLKDVVLTREEVEGLMQGLLYGVAPNDPLTFVTVAAVLLLIALAASVLPARRAIGISPHTAMGTASSTT